MEFSTSMLVAAFILRFTELISNKIHFIVDNVKFKFGFKKVSVKYQLSQKKKKLRHMNSCLMIQLQKSITYG